MSSIKNRKKAKENYSAIASDDQEERDITPEEKRLLQRYARKVKWVRRLRKCNDYLHAICKSST